MSRSKWKNPHIKKIIEKTKKLVAIHRNFEITPSIINKTFKVHNGKLFIKLSITDEMIGHKIGEFVPTRSKFGFKKKRKVTKK